MRFLLSLPLFLFSLFFFSSLPLVPAPAPTSLSGEYRHTDVEPEPGWLYGIIPPQQPQWTIHSNKPRPPGTFLLNMLIKNEAVHLNRTLPKWAKIIDYWIIGVDDANTDESPEIIKRHLGHIPGHIEIVHFDGMGPTWTILVEKALKLFPQATHGIIADADFAPMVDRLDKMELDLRCSKHMYTIWTEDHRNERKMDWIYRNVKGARVTRRTHQIVEVPKLPNQEVFQTLINLPIEEREGGYQDRSGEKNQRYIGFLEADLRDYPDDTRTLYYLGYAHHDIFVKNKDNPSQSDWDNLSRGVEYFKRRGDITEGNAEERWFALLKIAEIYERYYRDWDKAARYYGNCTDLDPERADAWFYLGQHYRLWGQIETSMPYLKKAASLPIPQRSLFQWHYLYSCLSKLEYARAAVALKDPTLKQLKSARKWLRQADCREGDPGNMGEWKGLLDSLNVKVGKLQQAEKAKEKLEKVAAKKKKDKVVSEETENDGEEEKETKKSKSSSSSSRPNNRKELAESRALAQLEKAVLDGRSDLLDKLIQWFLKQVDELDSQLSETTEGIELYSSVMERIDELTKYHEQLKHEIEDAIPGPNVSCKVWRSKLKGYLKLMADNEEFIQETISNKRLIKAWSGHNAALRGICR